MSSHRYPTRTPPKKPSYADDSSDGEYSPSSSSSSSSSPTLKTRLDLPAPPKPKASSPSMTKSSTFPQYTSKTKTNAFFRANLIPPTPTTKPQPPKNPDTCPHCSSVRSSLCLRGATTWVCPNNCGWGHYDGDCGVRIPLTPAYLEAVSEKERDLCKREFEEGVGEVVERVRDGDCGYVSGEEDFGGFDGEAEVEEEEEVVVEGKEEKSLMFAWDRVKEGGEERGYEDGKGL